MSTPQARDFPRESREAADAGASVQAEGWRGGLLRSTALGQWADILAPLLVASADADIPYIMGSALMRRAEAAQGEAADALRTEARRYFGRAYRLNSNHVPSLYAFAESYTGVTITEQAAENAMNALLLAHQLAPQVLEISLNAAVMLIGERRESEAVPILRSIAHDPHGDEVAARARALLEQIEGAQ